ncbi:hypothetical protein HDE_06025 [Halotydeus destructor]|nr:hypothetical protein HDE_06025 [Halotydeus destructor]
MTSPTAAFNISKLDTIYRKTVLSKFFTQGWGEPEKMKRIFAMRKLMRDKDKCNGLIDNDHPITIDKEVESNASYTVFEGHFESPMVKYFGNMIPKEAHAAKFQLVLPKKWNHETLKPICIHLAGTGDHYFWRRRVLMAKPLLKESGIASIILENPFYGHRKPQNQTRSSLLNVSDIFIMGGCLILECIALLNWCVKMGYGPQCVTGISMGGHMAALAGSSWNKPVSLVPCLSWTTASCVFTQGVMSDSIPWDVLENHYTSFGEDCRKELQEMIESPENNDMFKAGRQFAKDLDTDTLEPELKANMLLSAIGMFKRPSSQHHVRHKTKLDVLNFMRGIMDECTHLGNYSTPVDPELAVIVSALRDGYVPQANLIPLTQVWPGSTQRILDCGHVAAIIWYSQTFRQAIVDSLELNAKKYHGSSLFTQETGKAQEAN